MRVLLFILLILLILIIAFTAVVILAKYGPKIITGGDPFSTTVNDASNRSKVEELVRLLDRYADGLGQSRDPSKATDIANYMAKLWYPRAPWLFTTGNQWTPEKWSGVINNLVVANRVARKWYTDIIGPPVFDANFGRTGPFGWLFGRLFGGGKNMVTKYDLNVTNMLPARVNTKTYFHNLAGWSQSPGELPDLGDLKTDKNPTIVEVEEASGRFVAVRHVIGPVIPTPATIPAATPAATPAVYEETMSDEISDSIVPKSNLLQALQAEYVNENKVLRYMLDEADEAGLTIPDGATKKEQFRKLLSKHSDEPVSKNYDKMMDDYVKLYKEGELPALITLADLQTGL